MHSRHHLELKSEYPLGKDVMQPVYDMDFYFFYPSQLQINTWKIGVKRFLSHVKMNIRFSSPSLSLERLVSPECALSPLTRIRSILSLSAIEKPSGQDKILYELRMLTNIYRAEIAGFAVLMRDELRQYNREHLCRQRIGQYLEEITGFLKSFRSLHPLFMTPEVTGKQREALNWADESISIITEQNLHRLYSYCGMLESPEELRMKFEEITMREFEHRRSMNYQYLYNEADSRSGERLAYRDSILKKWSQSALYMTREESSTPRRVSHLLAGAAAGIAMLFAVFAAIFAGKLFIPNSAPWVLLIVTAYIFKDRIKEILRNLFIRFSPWLIADQLTILVDPAVNRRVGKAKGIVQFGKAGDAPAEIQNLRYRRTSAFRSILPDQDLLHYQRTMRLNNRKLMHNHSRVSGVTEIIRLNIEDWLREMDDPKDVFYRLENGKKLKIKGNRVYVIHLVISLKERFDKKLEDLYHYRIVFNKSGILRIETAGEDPG